MKKIVNAYCARCEFCQKRGEVTGTAGISTAADIRDGVYDNVCTVQVDPDGGPLVIDRWMQAALDNGIKAGALKIVGSVILAWDEGEQRYRKFMSLTKYAEQFLWEPRTCENFKLAKKFENWNKEKKTQPSNVTQYFDDNLNDVGFQEDVM